MNWFTTETPTGSGQARPVACAGAAGAPLTAAQEQELGDSIIRRGCRTSWNQLVSANVGLVHTIARNYARLGAGMDELVERGMAGLVQAVDTFDPALGLRFSTHASWWIKLEMRRVLTERDRREGGRIPGDPARRRWEEPAQITRSEPPTRRYAR